MRHLTSMPDQPDDAITHLLGIPGAEAHSRLARNLADYCRLLAGVAPGGRVEEGAGFVLFGGAHPYPGTHTNGVIRYGAGVEASAETILTQADEFFRPRRCSYTVWIRDGDDADLEALCQARSFGLHAPIEGMPTIFRPLPIELDSSRIGPATRLVRVETLATAVDALSVAGRAFGMHVPTETLAKIFFAPEALLDERVTSYVAYLDDVAVSTSQAFVAHGLAGLYSVATLDDARGLGLGQAVTAAAATATYAAQCRIVGATSSAMGAPIYTQKMGFVQLARWRRYFGQPLP
jgi:hypothetical protein